MDTVLEACQLGKRYARQWALRECSLRVPAGRIAALVGPNGAGKSTLLHLAVGLLRRDAGSIRVFGQDPHDNTGALSDIGFVAQDTPLYEDFTVEELNKAGLKINRRWDAGLVRQRLAQVGIPHHKAVGTLSGGQRAQVALALALAKRPRLLLLDEPVASLDPLARKEFLQSLMGSVAESGTSVLLSSHLLADLERTCDYVIVLKSGRVRLADAVDDLIGEYKRLVGPRHDGAPVAGVRSILQASHTDRQSTLLVRTTGEIADPNWTVHDVTLEDVILAHLAMDDVEVMEVAA
ncbi:MAG TPA: ABC transporter ATP-binding protein [Candidatus Limnocylindrales bacterium]|nr:ABC transporter ATP-binding protein [Candidatus Limnocylindrales bacterium]